MKNKTYVAVEMGTTEHETQIKYVTQIDNNTKAAWWKSDAPALAMSKSNAENLYFGLRCNGYKAMIITLPDYEEPHN